jgi:hypothetical protein
MIIDVGSSCEEVLPPGAPANLSGCSYIPVSLGGRDYLAGLDFSPEALAARAEYGRRAILDYETIFALWKLPTGGRVKIESIAESELALLAGLPPSLVSLQGSTIERHVVPVVDVKVLVASCSQPAAAWSSFGDIWWAPIEVAVLGARPSSLTQAKATRFGIGLVADGAWVTPPRLKRAGRPTPLRWWQSELVLSQALQIPNLPIA